MSIQVLIKSVYGVERIYPVCTKAKVLARLVGQATLTRADIVKIKELGFEIFVVAEPVEL